MAIALTLGFLFAALCVAGWLGSIRHQHIQSL